MPCGEHKRLLSKLNRAPSTHHTPDAPMMQL